jgi:hypothetical protein
MEQALLGQKYRLALVCHDSEKIGAARGLCTVVFHTMIIAPGGDVGFRAVFY